MVTLEDSSYPWLWQAQNLAIWVVKTVCIFGALCLTGGYTTLRIRTSEFKVGKISFRP